MRQILPVCVWIALALSARADVIEFQNSAKSEGRVLAFFNQRFEFADKDGSVTHVKLQEVERINFDSRTAAITMRDRTILNGELLGLEDGVLTVGVANGEPRHVAAAEVTDLTVNSTVTEAATRPPPPPSRPKPTPAPASDPRPQAKGSIDPKRGKITIVDFYADWCGPCKHIGPILEKIAEGNPDIVLQKVNIDKHRDLAKEYNVTAIPHIFIYDKWGGQVADILGADEQRVRKAVATASGGP
jgi:thioredoxin 1